MFICDFGGHQSQDGEAEKLIVVEWRPKTYESKELPPLPGTNVKRWTRPGKGYEAAVVKRACSTCVAGGVKHAPTPRELDALPVVPVGQSQGLGLVAA